MDDKKRTRKILAILRRAYPKLKTPLIYETPFQLVIATLLSAQCTDALVNKVTPELFKKFPTARKMGKTAVADVAAIILPVNYYKTKARHCVAAAQMIVRDFKGEVPRSMADLIRLPGVGRKTANVILSAAFGVNEGLVVDTHVKRLANRLGLTTHQAPAKIEQDLMPLLPTAEWADFSLALIFHGRRRCTARNPDHAGCEVAHLCPSAPSKHPKA